MVDFLNDKFTPIEEDAQVTPAMPDMGQDKGSDYWSSLRPITEEELTSSKPTTTAAPTVDDDPEEEYGFDTGKRYKKDDLKTGKAADDIREYMRRRAGEKYRVGGPIDNDRLVEDFVDHWRFFNTNIVGTAGEARFISAGDDEDKAATKRALELYDGLGNVFVNDGFYGAVDGVWDYVQAAATDPSNYIGLLTGGLAKGGAFAGSQATKQMVRRAAAEAGRAAMKSGATQQAAEAAGREAAEQAMARFSLQAVKTKTAREALDRLSEVEKRNFLNRTRRGATRDAMAAATRGAETKAIGATTAFDALVATAHDYQIQSLRMEVGAQEEYSTMQTAFSSLLGGVAGGAQLIGRSVGKGGSGLEGAQVSLSGAGATREAGEAAERALIREVNMSQPLMGEEGTKAAAKDMLEGVRTWKEKWQAGRNSYTNQTTEADLLTRIVLGSDGKGKKDGLVKLYKDAGLKMPADMRISDVLSNVVLHMPQKELDEINTLLKPTHMNLGEISESRAKLSDLVANESNRAGQVLNVFSQAKRLVDSNVVVGDDIMREATETILEREAEEASKLKGVAYGQNIWRRLLVSSPATTAANVAGFSSYAVGSSLADILTGTGYTLAGLTKKGAERAEYFRVGKVYRNMLSQKMRYLMDPFTTHDAYMKFLKENEDVSKVLFETVTGGVERSAKRFGINPDSKWFQRSEGLADGANRLTGVSIQDTFTKSQMFMGELDKYLQINKGVSLRDIINSGDLARLDNDTVGAALDGTMKSVFSKDYTRDDNDLLSYLAKTVEQASNTPGIGTVIPFGRFMNNVVATAHQWGPTGFLAAASKIAQKDKRNLGTVEALSRSMVGMGAIALAMQYDEEKQNLGMAATDIELTGGQVGDVKNVYPLSLIMVAGRYARYVRDDQAVPRELQQEFLNQLAIGQVARDMQFGNDLYALLGWLDSDEARSAGWTDALKGLGNIVAGATRPIDAINRMVGFVNNSDVAKDVRQARGVDAFTQSATKYVDNLIEVFIDDLDSVTGEELRVATREGSLQDANPAARIAGLVVKPPQNATELAYGMSEMLTYTANMRTKNPAYDKAYNALVAPLLEKAAERMLQDPLFVKGSVDERRIRLRKELKVVRQAVKAHMAQSVVGEDAINSLRRQAQTMASAEARRAGKAMLSRQGVSAPINELGYKELQLYMEFVKSYQAVYERK